MTISGAVGLKTPWSVVSYICNRLETAETNGCFAVNAPPDLTEKAKRIRVSPFLLNLPRRSSGAAPARHPTERSRATTPPVFPRPSNLTKRIRASPFLLNLPRRSSGAAPARHPTERSRATTSGSPTLPSGRPSNCVWLFDSAISPLVLRR